MRFGFLLYAVLACAPVLAQDAENSSHASRSPV